MYTYAMQCIMYTYYIEFIPSYVSPNAGGIPANCRQYVFDEDFMLTLE